MDLWLLHIRNLMSDQTCFYASVLLPNYSLCGNKRHKKNKVLRFIIFQGYFQNLPLDSPKKNVAKAQNIETKTVCFSVSEQSVLTTKLGLSPCHPVWDWRSAHSWSFPSPVTSQTTSSNFLGFSQSVCLELCLNKQPLHLHSWIKCHKFRKVLILHKIV